MKAFEVIEKTALPESAKEALKKQDVNNYESMYNAYLNSVMHLKELRKPENKKQFLPLESVQFPLDLLKEYFTLKPVPKPAKTVFEALKPVFLKDILRPAMCGMAVHSGYAYATDANILIKYHTKDRENYFVDSEGRKSKVVEVAKDSGIYAKWMQLDGFCLPDYNSVIPDVSEIKEWANVDLRKIYPFFAAVSDWAKTCFLSGKNKYCNTGEFTNVVFYHETNGYNVQLFTRLIEALLKLGENQVKVYHSGDKRALVLVGKKSTSLVMPIYLKDGALDKPYIDPF